MLAFDTEPVSVEQIGSGCLAIDIIADAIGKCRAINTIREMDTSEEREADKIEMERRHKEDKL